MAEPGFNLREVSEATHIVIGVSFPMPSIRPFSLVHSFHDPLRKQDKLLVFKDKEHFRNKSTILEIKKKENSYEVKKRKFLEMYINAVKSELLNIQMG